MELADVRVLGLRDLLTGGSRRGFGGCGGHDTKVEAVEMAAGRSGEGTARLGSVRGRRWLGRVGDGGIAAERSPAALWLGGGRVEW